MRDLNAIPLPELFVALTRFADVPALFAMAKREELGDAGCDVTSEALIPVELEGKASYVARRAGVVAGLAALHYVIEAFGPECRFDVSALDGDHVTPGAIVARIHGPMRQILAVERTSLNLLSQLSGIATKTAEYVRLAEASSPTHVPKICDTRKTTPGLRALEKYAVRCGGGWLHRCGLHDAMLIKDNHLAALANCDDFKSLAEHIGQVRAQHSLRFVELEVDSMEQFDRALAVAPGVLDMILLDNMSPELMRDAVQRRNQTAPGVKLEASGNVSTSTIGAIAASGVDRISVGALTHSAPALDFGLDMA